MTAKKSDMSKGTQESREILITTNSRITFAALAMLAGPLIAGTVLYFKVDAMQREMRASWTINQQIVWTERLSSKNPTLNIPPIQDVITLVGKRNERESQ